jgi:PBP4 family serine-type D-alanyl-D-alanine carboxypeptidase
MLKESSNLVAEQMLQVVAAYKVPSEKEHELKLVDGFLTNMIGVNEEDLALSDASGLSYQTKATPSAIIRTLNSMYKNNNYDFLNALPVSGIDGTLKDFTNYKIKGKIKAKTGTLLDSGVRGLAGYIEAGHDVYSFVLIVNSPNSRDMSFYEQDLLEKIVSILEN